MHRSTSIGSSDSEDKVNMKQGSLVTRLIESSTLGKVEDVEILLTEKSRLKRNKDGKLVSRFDVSSVNEYGESALYHASYHGHKEVVAMLLAAGAQVNTINKQGETPLYWAVCNGDEYLVQLLLDYKAEPNIANNVGKTPLFWAAKTGKTRILTMLLEAGADVTKCTIDTGDTALTAAVALSFTSTVEILLQFNADIHQANNKGCTPISIAQSLNNHAIVKLLEKREEFLKMPL